MGIHVSAGSCVWRDMFVRVERRESDRGGVEVFLHVKSFCSSFFFLSVCMQGGGQRRKFSWAPSPLVKQFCKKKKLLLFFALRVFSCFFLSVSRHSFHFLFCCLITKLVCPAVSLRRCHFVFSQSSHVYIDMARLSVALHRDCFHQSSSYVSGQKSAVTLSCLHRHLLRSFSLCPRPRARPIDLLPFFFSRLWFFHSALPVSSVLCRCGG